VLARGTGLVSAAWAKVQDPGLIFFLPYLISALLLTLIWLFLVERMHLVAALRYLISKFGQFGSSRSSRLDLYFSIIQVLFLRAPLVAAEAAAFAGMLTVTTALFASAGIAKSQLALPTAVEAALATIVTMLAIDFASYAVHRLMHAVAPLWRLHAVHHSAENLTLLTTYRQHPLEPLLLNLGRGAAAGVGLALLHSLLPTETPVVTAYGLGVGFFAYMFTVNLHHSPVPVRYPRIVRMLLVSPHVHHIHHSALPTHHGTNFGVVFSIWDRLFGTYRDEAVGLGELQFGLGNVDPFRQSLVACLLMPLSRIYQPPPPPDF